MLGGGVADKLGNEYELRWTLVEVLRVLLGRMDEIRVEPFNEDSNGLEFRVSGSGVDEWHQCKRRRTSGSWTIKSLSDEGVLQAFSRKLSAPNTRCVFVSSDPTPALKGLIDKATLAETPADFYGSGGIGKADRGDLEKLNDVWLTDEETTFQWLRRCRVEVTSDSSLYRQLEGTCSLIFTTPADVALDRLARYVGHNIAHRLTTSVLVDAVASLNIQWISRFDSSLDATFDTATNAYLASLSSKIGGNELPVAHVDEMIFSSLAGENPITLIAGGAGSGKSVVLERVVLEARRLGWPVLAFRIDRHLGVRTLEDLGAELLEREVGPIASFGSRNAARPSLLVIDQVDAISDISGRTGRIRDLFFRMIEQSHFFPGMRVVAACRNYDLDRDSRLKELSELSVDSLFRLAPLDWAAAVMPVLASHGVDERALTERSKKVLSIPINLHLFVSILEAGDQSFGELSASRLFDRLVDIREQSIRAAGFNWTVMEAMGVVAQAMSSNQELTAPLAVLDRYSGAVDALSSSGLLTAIGRKLQFAHESFFDHTFSRHFVASGQSVHTMLVQDEQRLFRRTQVRQIFSRLRDNSTRAFLSNFREVMESGDVRYLVKDAVAYWLSEIDVPTAEELSIVEPWLFSGTTEERLARTAISGFSWLPILINSGLLERFTNGDSVARDFAFWHLKKSVAKDPDLCFSFLSNWWSSDRTGRLPELVNWFSNLYPDSSIGPLESLYGDAVAAIPANELCNKFVQSLDLGAWAHHDKSLGARILGLWLRKWMESFPKGHPFSDAGDGSHYYWIDEIAKSAPEQFLEEVIPSLAEAFRREQASIASGELSYPTLRPPIYQHDEEFLRSVTRSLEDVAAKAPEQAKRLLGPLGDTTEFAMFARLKAIAANGKELHELFVPLLAKKGIFEIGDGESDWIPFARAAAAVMPYLNEKDRVAVENSIFYYRPEYTWAKIVLRKVQMGELSASEFPPREYVIHQLRQSGRTERAILASIGRAPLSDRGRARLNELDRKFLHEPLPASTSARGGFVRSPISLDSAKLMSDSQWINAIRKYADSDRHWHDVDGRIGGSRELAMMLAACAKENPIRFVALLDKLPSEARIDYPEAIIGALRDCALDGSIVARAINSARRWALGDFGRTVCWTVERHPSAGLDRSVLADIMNSAENGSASDTSVTTISRARKSSDVKLAEELLRPESDLSSSGINSERGAAYEALASILWESEEVISDVLCLVKRRLDLETLGSVRICMAHAINSIGRYEPDQAIDLLSTLIASDRRVVEGQACRHMLDWIAHRDAAMIARISQELARSSRLDEISYAFYLDSLLALLDDKLNANLVARFPESALLRQIAAYRATRNVASARYGSRSREWLIGFFQDGEKMVREDASHIDWAKLLDQKRSDESNVIDFVVAYVRSSTFPEHPGRLMRALEVRASHYPELTFLALERLLDGELGAGRNRISVLHHLGRVLMELYRSISSDADAEKRILDLFDIYLSKDLYGIRDEISAYERH